MKLIDIKYLIHLIDILVTFLYNIFYKCINKWVINSAVECLPYKQKVTGSNPVSPIETKYRAYRLTD